MKRAKLRIIHLLDWIDVHVFDHQFMRVCDWIGNSEWWGDPVNLDDLSPEQVREEVNKPYPNYEPGSYSYEQIMAMRDTNAES